MLRTRILSAMIFAPIVAGVTYAGGWWFFATMLAVAGLASYEFYRLMEKGGYQPSIVLGLLLTIAFILNARFPGPTLTQALVFGGVLISLSWQLMWRPKGSPMADWALTLGGALWIGGLLGHFVLLRDLSSGFDLGAGFRWVALVFLVTWINDSGAYLVWRAKGMKGRQAFPYLSPIKTWEGTVSGWLSGVAATVLLGRWLVDLPLGHGLAMGMLIATGAILGDLSVSMVKRQVGTKDTSNLIPGHGGMFDRLDSLLFVVTIVYYYAALVLGI